MNSATSKLGATQLAPRPQTQVECFVNEIAAALESFDKELTMHEEKISPILAPCEPAKNGAEVAPPEEMICPVADRLRSHRKYIDALRRRLAGLTERAQA